MEPNPKRPRIDRPSESGEPGSSRRSDDSGARGRRRECLPALQTRPASAAGSKKGKNGKEVRLQSNHFKLSTTKRWTLYKHHVDFSNGEDRTFVKKSLLKPHRNKFIGYLFDGSTLYTIREACTREAPLELTAQTETGTEPVKITIKYVGTCEPGDYQYFQVFGLILRECLSFLRLQLIRRNYYDPRAKVEVREFRLELWPGYILSIAQYEREVLLQAEISYKVLRKDTAYDLFHECSRSRDFRVAYSSAITGQIVMTSYNNKTYRIDEVNYQETPNGTFTMKAKGGETVTKTYMQYYMERYNQRINDPSQPLLVSRSNARDRRAGANELVYLVPELCILTGLTDDMRGNYQLMRALASHTSVNPGERKSRLLGLNRRLHEVPEIANNLRNWGMELDRDLTDIPGRLLPPEKIVVADRQTHDAGPEADWTRSLRSNKMLLNVDIKNWIILYPSRSEREMRSFADMLTRVGQGMHWNISHPTRYSLQDDRTGSYTQMLDRGINERNPQCVICIVPNNRSDRYSAIKKKTIIDKPTPSQIVTTRSITARGAMSICTKIAIQLNCKVGGAPWSVSVPVSELMVVGFDICHDPSDKRKSYSGMVATLDNTYARYHSAVTHHTAGETMATNLGFNLLRAIDTYERRNSNLPKLIVVYRDGVGEGNLRYVYETEVQSIKKSLAGIYEKKGKTLKLAFIVVTKKVNTRLFYGDKNPPPGTIVDDVVTDPFKYDFYLVSQTVRQGTVSPTHYNVLEDTTGFTPDHIQRLTYKFTHLYFNWSGTVRVPAPCQYARKLAFLTANSVGVAHSNMDQLLYFL